MQDEIRCPKCRSNQITANKKGFSAGRAIEGELIAGESGLIAGAIGSNQIIITCLNCGHEFLPGQGYKPPVAAKSVDDPSLSELDKKVMRLWAAGQKLEAIKLYKEETGIGLKAAKDYVQQINVGSPGSAGNKGCAGVVLWFIAGGALLLLLMH